MLKGFSPEDRDDMIENGEITVTCEFCSTTYRLTRKGSKPLTSGSGAAAAA